VAFFIKDFSLPGFANIYQGPRTKAIRSFILKQINPVGLANPKKRPKERKAQASSL
jgi:hypothetical protein